MQFTYSESDQLLRRAIRDFSVRELEPGALERDAAESFDAALYRKVGDLGLAGLGIDPERDGGGGGLLQTAIAVEELAPLRSEHEPDPARQPLARHHRHRTVRHRRPEGEVRPAAGAGRGHRRLLPHRAQRGQRRRRRQHPRRAQGRRLRPQRREDLHHQRRRGRYAPRLRHRPAGNAGQGRGQRDRGGGHAGPRSPQAARQAGDARLHDLRRLLRRRLRSRREPRGPRRRRLQGRHADPRREPSHHRGAGGGHRAGGLRPRHEAREPTGAVRPDHCRLPGRPVDARRHGDPDRSGASADLPSRLTPRRWPALLQASFDGEALRQRDRHQGRRHGAPSYTAASATSRRAPSSAITATPRSPRSTRARRRSSASLSPATSSPRRAARAYSPYSPRAFDETSISTSSSGTPSKSFCDGLHRVWPRAVAVRDSRWTT